MAFSIDEVAEVANSCRDVIYSAIKDKRLRAKRQGRRTIVLRSDLEAYLQSLPDVDLKSGNDGEDLAPSQLAAAFLRRRKGSRDEPRQRYKRISPVESAVRGQPGAVL